jgi:hypothetical protein
LVSRSYISKCPYDTSPLSSQILLYQWMSWIYKHVRSCFVIQIDLVVFTAGKIMCLLLSIFCSEKLQYYTYDWAWPVRNIEFMIYVYKSGLMWRDKTTIHSTWWGATKFWSFRIRFHCYYLSCCQRKYWRIQRNSFRKNIVILASPYYWTSHCEFQGNCIRKKRELWGERESTHHFFLKRLPMYTAHILNE